MTEAEQIARIDDMICDLIEGRRKLGSSNDIISVSLAAVPLIVALVQEPDDAGAQKLAGIRINALLSNGRLRGGTPGTPLSVVLPWER